MTDPTPAPPTADEVKAEALRLGFIACGITDPRPSASADRFDEWLAKGYAGTMRYLHRQARRRKDPRLIVPEARSVVVVLDNYHHPDTPEDLAPPKVAKYARGEDYHRATIRRLEALAAWLRARGAGVARTYSDAGPVPERELAQRAGLGWIGKNTLLVRPGVGSFFFIGSVFTDLALAPDLPFELDRCGSCTRCLDACPTDAFVGPRLLDATRCISYLTIESKGELPDELAARLDGWAFGCDVCQDVCPWNVRFAEPATVPEFTPRRDLPKGEPELFETMDEEEFQRRYGDRPFERPGLAGMRRNLRAVFARTPRGDERKDDA
jgi:epoxyqueuosine reductase